MSFLDKLRAGLRRLMAGRHGADEPYLAMAERLVYNSYNGPAKRRVARLVDLAQKTHADGAVVFCHWGCKETLGASQLMKSALEEAGFPTLVLDGDGCARRDARADEDARLRRAVCSA